ncbi:MAG TPA: DUF6531 domain-containing protein, partial [Thermoanaerobaculia bacterium]|nr:DUF6531 domain-containing protein [Thermoanaerobaculia bacterium]
METVLLVADPRARRDYRRQDAPGTEADEEGQCRRCDWPAYLPDPADSASEDPALNDVEELLAGPYVRAFLFADEGAGASVAQSTRDAVAWFEARAQNYPLPYGWAEVAAGAAGVPSPLQVSLAEPAANPAIWDAGEAGVAAALTGGELLLSAADHAVAGRSVPFVFERSYRSGTLGYGPLGAAGWWSPLFARIRELPSGEAEYHDGMGRVWRFPPATVETVPEGYEEDTSATSYLVPEGLYVRLRKLPGGLGWVLVTRQHGTARFDGAGRLTEVADRHFRGGTAGERGSRLRMGYDAFGQLVSVVDDLGRRYRLEYHDDPRPVAAGGDGPRYGLLERLVDFAGREVEYRWDGQRRLVEVLLPEVENATSAYGSFSFVGAARPTLAYAYDPALGVSAAETATGALLHGEYAKLRLASFELPPFLDGGASEPRARLSYEAATGRLASVSFPGEPGPVTWSLEQAAGSSAGPAEQVDVTAPWGHTMEHVLTGGRLTAFREELEVHRPVVAPSP